MQGEKQQILPPLSLSMALACLIAYQGLGTSKKRASASQFWSSSENPSLTTSRCVTLMFLSCRDWKSSLTDSDLSLLNSNVQSCPVYPIILEKEVERDPLPVPAYTTLNPGWTFNLKMIAEMSGENRIWVLLARVSVTRGGSGFKMQMYDYLLFLLVDFILDPQGCPMIRLCKKCPKWRLMLPPSTSFYIFMLPMPMQTTTVSPAFISSPCSLGISFSATTSSVLGGQFYIVDQYKSCQLVQTQYNHLFGSRSEGSCICFPFWTWLEFFKERLTIYLSLIAEDLWNSRRQQESQSDSTLNQIWGMRMLRNMLPSFILVRCSQFSTLTLIFSIAFSMQDFWLLSLSGLLLQSDFTEESKKSEWETFLWDFASNFLEKVLLLMIRCALLAWRKSVSMASVISSSLLIQMYIGTNSSLVMQLDYLEFFLITTSTFSRLSASILALISSKNLMILWQFRVFLKACFYQKLPSFLLPSSTFLYSQKSHPLKIPISKSDSTPLFSLAGVTQVRILVFFMTCLLFSLTCQDLSRLFQLQRFQLKDYFVGVESRSVIQVCNLSRNSKNSEIEVQVLLKTTPLRTERSLGGRICLRQLSSPQRECWQTTRSSSWWMKTQETACARLYLNYDNIIISELISYIKQRVSVVVLDPDLISVSLCYYVRTRQGNSKTPRVLKTCLQLHTRSDSQRPNWFRYSQNNQLNPCLSRNIGLFDFLYRSANPLTGFESLYIIASTFTRRDKQSAAKTSQCLCS